MKWLISRAWEGFPLYANVFNSAMNPSRARTARAACPRPATYARQELHYHYIRRYL